MYITRLIYADSRTKALSYSQAVVSFKTLCLEERCAHKTANNANEGSKTSSILVMRQFEVPDDDVFRYMACSYTLQQPMSAANPLHTSVGPGRCKGSQVVKGKQGE